MITWPKLFVFIRHGESLGNTLSKDERARLSIPTFEYPLTERGRKQAEITGVWLLGHFPAFDAHYVSTYLRAKETLSLLCPGVTPREDSRLDEVDRGIEHVLTQVEIAEKYPEEVERKKLWGPYRYRPLGGLSWEDVEQIRVRPFRFKLKRKHAGRSVVAVGHGTWFVNFLRMNNHLSVEEVIRMFEEDHPANASVTIFRGVERDGKCLLELEAYNIIPWYGII